MHQRFAMPTKRACWHAPAHRNRQPAALAVVFSERGLDERERHADCQRLPRLKVRTHIAVEEQGTV